MRLVAQTDDGKTIGVIEEVQNYKLVNEVPRQMIIERVEMFQSMLKSKEYKDAEDSDK